MKKIAFVLIFSVLAACATTSHISRVDTPSLDQKNFKSVDSTGRIVGIYIYHSAFPTDNGDMTMKAIMNALNGKASFYKLNVKDLSTDDQRYVSTNIVDGLVLPSYVFYANGKKVNLVKGARSTREDADKLGRELFQGFEDRNWYQERKAPRKK